MVIIKYFYILFLYFVIYSAIGWVCETAYCSIYGGKFINRGFLNGPFCPVYGFGALAVIFLLSPISGNLAILYLAGVIVTSILEYITGYLLEKLFHMKWWDYSKYRFNIRGRVCLLNSALFGVLSVVAVRGIHPAVVSAVGKIPAQALAIICFTLLLYFLLDLSVSVYTVLSLNGRLYQLENILGEIREWTQTYKDMIKQNFEEEVVEEIERFREQQKEKLHRASEMLEKLDVKHTALEEKGKLLFGRILAAFPNISSTKYPISLERIRQAIQEKRK